MKMNKSKNGIGWLIEVPKTHTSVVPTMNLVVLEGPTLG